MKKIIKKYKIMTKPVKAVFWFSLSNFLVKGMAFFTIPIYSRILSPNEYGILNIYSSYEQIILILSTFELSLGAFQRGIVEFKNDNNTFKFAILILSNFITIIIFLLIIIFRFYLNFLEDIPFIIIMLLFIYALLQPAFSCWIILKRSEYEYKKVIIITTIYAFITSSLSIYAVIMISKTAYTKAGMVLLISILYFFYFYLNSINIKIKIGKIFKYIIYSINFQLPLVLHALSYLVLSQSDRIMIGLFINNTSVALYSVAYNLGSIINVIQVSINQVFTPWRYQKMKDKQYSEIRENSTMLLLIVSGFLLIFISVSPEIMKLLFTNVYYESIWCIPPIALGIYFLFLYTMFSDIEAYFNETKFIMYVSFFCGFLNIVLNYFGIKYYGYIACAYTTLICYVVYAIGHYLYMIKIIKKHIGNINIFDMKIIIFITTAVCIFTIIICILYDYVFYRLIILTMLILYFTLLIINKKGTNP